MSPRTDDAQRSPTVRVPIALLAALALGGGGTAIGSRYLGEPPAPAATVNVAPIYQKLDGLEERLRQRETASARTDEKLDALMRALDRIDQKLDGSQPARRR